MNISYTQEIVNKIKSIAIEAHGSEHLYWFTEQCSGFIQETTILNEIQKFSQKNYVHSKFHKLQCSQFTVLSIAIRILIKKKKLTTYQVIQLHIRTFHHFITFY